MSTSLRRQRLFDLLADGIAVLPAGKEVSRNRDTDYEFRQDSDFYYLTAFEEPDTIAVFNPSHPTEKYVLFVRPRGQGWKELWNDSAPTPPFHSVSSMSGFGGT